MYMKKIFTLIAVFAAGTFVANAQRAVGGISTEFTPKPFSANVDKADTTVVVPESFNISGCDTLTVYTVQNNGGYVSGFNTYGDTEKAQLNFGSGQVFGVFASIAGKAAAAGFETSTFAGKVYSVSGTTFTQLGSANLNFADIDTSAAGPIPGFNFWQFASPVAVSGGWVASIEVGKYGATSVDAGLVIYSNEDGCGNNRAWELWEDGTWHSFTEIDNWELDLDMLIGAFVIDFATNTEADLFSGVAVFPNPVVNQFSLAYHTKVSGAATVEVIDAAGRVIRVINEGTKAAGSYVSTIDFEGMSSGLYTYRLTVGKNQTTGKFIVK
jgi:hypothetical protein